MRIHYAGLQPHCCCVGKGRSFIVTASSFVADEVTDEPRKELRPSG